MMHGQKNIKFRQLFVGEDTGLWRRR